MPKSGQIANRGMGHVSGQLNLGHSMGGKGAGSGHSSGSSQLTPVGKATGTPVTGTTSMGSSVGTVVKDVHWCGGEKNF